MSTDSTNAVDRLLDRYEEHRQEGRRVTAEELCREHPELIGAVAEQIKALEWIPPTGTSGHSIAGGFAGAEPVDVPDQLGRYELKECIGEGGLRAGLACI